MRRTVAVLAAVVGLTLITGCGNSPEQVAGAAEPVGGVTPVSSGPAATAQGTPTTPAGSASTAPAGSTSGTAGGTATPGSTGTAAKLVLGPNGLGALKLGMTRADAVKTGLLVADGPVGDDAGCNTDYRPKAAGQADAPVFFSDRGLVAFTAYPGVATPEGIKLGSTVAAVKKAYPDWEIMTGPGADGRGWAKVPGNSKAVYNISVGDGEVDHMNLQLRTQNCYE